MELLLFLQAEARQIVGRSKINILLAIIVYFMLLRNQLGNVIFYEVQAKK